MIKINDYAKKNYLGWEIKDLPEGEVYRLDLTDNNFDLLLFAHYKYFEDSHKVFLPNISKQQLLMFQTYITGQDELNRQQYGSPQNETQYYVLCDKTELICDNFHYITPDWSKYIAKDNTVLFLSEEDENRYIATKEKTKSILLDELKKAKQENIIEFYIALQTNIRKISIILPSIHSQNIQEISNIAKDLKENYGVEYVEVIPPHCYLSIFYDKTPHIPLYSLQHHLANYECEDDVECINYIDKIITTDSTGVLKVQDTEHLQVVDCQEFFNNFLQNDKS